ncbi:FMN-dependent dehydrogenase [Penicillium desertorum]|uniref:FMN-dependent dehydrogenase n=1 Tax=Penicillium desertorum TaxID=1303715 RepID=A0A9W9WH93_9EURO|nr:FMN-dependent dehydrogenase [Penicillium desertorum]
MNKIKEDPTLKEVENMEESTETYAVIMAAHKPNHSLMGSINALPNYIEYFGFLKLQRKYWSHSSRYRLMLNIAFSWFGQFSGNKYVKGPGY